MPAFDLQLYIVYATIAPTQSRGGTPMICTLMHKRLAVADLELDDATAFIQKINTVYAPAHLPVGVLPGNGIVDRAALERVVDRPLYSCQPFWYPGSAGDS